MKHLLAVTLTNQLNKWSQIVHPVYRMAPSEFLPLRNHPCPSSCFESRRTWATLGPPPSTLLPLSSLSSVALQESHWIHKGLREHFHQCTRRLHCISPLLRLIPSSAFPNVSNACRRHVFEIVRSVLIAQAMRTPSTYNLVLNIYAGLGRGCAI